MRERLAHRAIEAIGPDAWVIDDTGFPTDGTASPGVARQYSGTLGKVDSCQIGMSISAVTDVASCRCLGGCSCPSAGTRSARPARRRPRPSVTAVPGPAYPPSFGHREKWRLALDIIDKLAGWGLTPPVVVADAGYGDITEFRDGLTTRGRAWVVQVRGVLSAHAEGARPELVPTSGRGRPSRPRYRTKPVALREHVLLPAAPPQCS
jgi:SRSO17 transposase